MAMCCGHKLSLLFTCPAAPIPPGTPKACSVLGQGTLVPICATPLPTLFCQGNMLGVLGFKKEDTPEASCCSPGSAAVPRCQVCRQRGDAMGMGSLFLVDGSASMHLGQSMICWHRHSWDYAFQQRTCTQALPVLRLWAKLEPK